MTAPTDDLVNALQHLQADSPGVTAVVLSSVDGRILASTTVASSERLRVSSVGAASLAIARKSMRDLQLGEVKWLKIQGNLGAILLVGVGQTALLSMVIASDVDVERLLREVKTTAERIAGLIPH